MLILLIKRTIYFEGFFLIWLCFRDIEFERFSEILAIWEGYIDRREPPTTLVCNTDILEAIIASAAKFGMLILHIKSANFIDGIFKRFFVLKILNLKVFGELIIFGESELISAE